MLRENADKSADGPGSGEMQAYRLLVEYDGADYAGWQRQPNTRSIQQTLEEALEEIVRHPVRCHAAGRTDAGVHALGQVVRFLTSAPHVDENAIVRGGNVFLPEDVRIVKAERCSAWFDPRRDARRRWYRYSMYIRPAAPTLERRRVAHLRAELDWSAVEKGLEYLRGEHDFQAFRSSSCTAQRTRLNLEAAHVDERPVHHLDFKCRSFLHNMVRIMTGLLIEVGVGKHRPEVAREMLATGRRVAQFGVAPPHGLVLMGVEYDDEGDDTKGFLS